MTYIPLDIQKIIFAYADIRITVSYYYDEYYDENYLSFHNITSYPQTKQRYLSKTVNILSLDHLWYFTKDNPGIPNI